MSIIHKKCKQRRKTGAGQSGTALFSALRQKAWRRFEHQSTEEA